jgi:hypothetical protein
LLSKILNWITIEPVGNRHVSNIILLIRVVEFMILLATDT